MLPTVSLLLALVAPFASALTLNAPSGSLTSAGTVTITWSSDSNDPQTFSLELSNPDQFRNDLAISATVQTSDGTITFEMPQVPPTSGYSFKAIAVSDINNVLSQTGQFDIGQSTATTAPTATGAAGNSTATGAQNGTVGATTSGTASRTMPLTSGTGTASVPSNTTSTSPTTSPGAAGIPVKFGISVSWILAGAITVATAVGMGL